MLFYQKYFIFLDILHKSTPFLFHYRVLIMHLLIKARKQNIKSSDSRILNGGFRMKENRASECRTESYSGSSTKEKKHLKKYRKQF